MAVRYRNTTYSLAGTVWQIDILDSQFSGAVTLFTTANNTFNLSYKGVTERLDPVMASTLTVPMAITNSSIEAFLLQTLTAQEERFSVKVYKNTVLDWVGVLLQDQIQLEDIAYPYFVDLTFTDGLARLKDIDYNDGSSTPLPYTGLDTILAHCIKLLSKAGTIALYGTNDAFLNTVVNWYETRHNYNYTIDPLVYTRVRHSVFYNYDSDGNLEWKKCSEVLEMILRTFNARILMANGMYQIIQVQEYARPTTYSRIYKKAGTYLSVSQNTSFRITPSSGTRKAGGLTKFFPPIRIITKTYKHNNSQLQNGSLLPPKTIYPTTAFLNTVQGGTVMNFDGAVVESFYSAQPTYAGQFYSKYKLTMIVTLLSDSSVLYLTNQLGNGDIQWTSSPNYVIVQTPLSPYGVGYWESPYPIIFTTPPLAGESSGTFKFEYIDSYNANGTHHVWYPGFDNFGNYCNEFKLTPGLGEFENDADTVFQAINTAVSGLPVASTIELKIPDTLIGDDQNTLNVGRFETSNQSTWADSSAWGVHKGTPLVDINQLSVNQNLQGQRIPTEKYTGTFISTSITALSSLVWGNRVFVPVVITINPAVDEISGEWFNVVIPAL